MYHIDDYTFVLSEDRIAQLPAQPADSCKLLVAQRMTQKITDTSFAHIGDFLSRPSLFVRNVTKVIQARLPLQSFAWEILFLQQYTPTRAEALVRPGKKFRLGAHVVLPEFDCTITVVEQTEDGRILECSRPRAELINTYGHLPLPPYITTSEAKEKLYQPTFAQTPGSVASPTASLHFTPELIASLSQAHHTRADVTLHVGIGTFKPVSVTDIREHKIHPEAMHIHLSLFSTIAHAKHTGRPVIAIGTTVTRTLESLPYLWTLLPQATKQQLSTDIQHWRENISSDCNSMASTYLQALTIEDNTISCTSCLYILPGHSRNIVDHLITNFHLPKSSLLVLVDSFLGDWSRKEVYTHALTNNYQFFSFGDAMLIV